MVSCVLSFRRKKVLYKGTEDRLTEGPRLYKINGWYYLFAAQGGTRYAHQSRVARAKSLYDTFETQPGCPLLTSLDAPYHAFQKSGHGSLVQTPKGEWYFAHLRGRPLHRDTESIVESKGWCPLGRETSIQKLIWNEEGWLQIEGGHNGLEEVEASFGVKEHKWAPDYPEKDDFNSDKLNIHFKNLRTPLEEDVYSLTDRPGHLRLYGHFSLASTYTQAHIARRWQNFHFEVEVKMAYEPNSEKPRVFSKSVPYRFPKMQRMSTLK